jgi:fucose permease
VPERTGLTATLRRRIALSFAAFVVIGATDGATGVLLPSLQAEYGVSKGVVSLLFLALTTGFIIAAFGSGLLVALLGQRRFLMLGAAVFALGALTISLRPPFAVVLAILLILGFGFAILDAGLNTYITGLPENTTRLNNLHAFYGIGGFLGPIVASGVLAVGKPWNAVYALWGVCGLALVVGFGIFFDAGPTGAHQATDAHGNRSLLTDALRLRLVWLAAIFMLFYVGAEVSVGSWSYSFLTEVRHHGDLISGWSVSGYWLGITLGRITLARLAARLRIPDAGLIRYCLIGAGIGALIVWAAPSPILTAFGLWLTGYSLGPIYPTTIALLPGLVPARLVPSAVGFLASLGSAGAALFPWLAGNLADAVGLWSLMPYVVALLIVLSGTWIALGMSTRDVKTEAARRSH